MRTIRLLPVVVVATGALLALKTIGLVTHGGYVLPGVGEVVAAEDAGATGVVLPKEQTLTDTSPTLEDTAPTVIGGEEEAPAADEATQEPATEETEDLQPMQVDEAGNIVPLADGAADTERDLLERLAERRTELDAYAEELDMRAALIEAAEKRVEERAATMEALEAQIASLVEERKAAEQNLIAGVVSMYETMRPRDAATIFNELDMEVLVRVSRAMAPRKMAPILAEMTPQRAQELTVRLAAADSTPPDQLTAEQLSELPQIVGQ